MACKFVYEDDLMCMEAWGGFRKELRIETEDITYGSRGCGGRGWMWGVAVFACCTVGAGAAEMAVECDVGASECTEG